MVFWLLVLIDGQSMAHNCSATVGPLQELHRASRLIIWHHKVLRIIASTQWQHCILCYPQRLNAAAEVSCTEEQLNSRRDIFSGLCKESVECEQNVENYKTKLSERYTVKSSTVVGTEHPIFGLLLECLFVFLHYFPLVKKL